MRTTISILLTLLGLAATADDATAFFDDSYVHEIRITFQDPNWESILFQSHLNDPADPYFPVRFEYGEVVLDPVGVRFKGESSFVLGGSKLSFKFDFDEYDEGSSDLHCCGLRKLNLNSCFQDPTYLREKLFYDFAARYVPTPRCVHTRLYVNDAYWGLYLAVEQIDKYFLQDRFGAHEDGNLYKAQGGDKLDLWSELGCTLAWLGSDAAPYQVHYQLKTNEAQNDYTPLIAFVDVLNNVPIGQLPDLLAPIADVEAFLKALALNSVFTNLDSYSGTAHNYYLYVRDSDSKITHIHWDTNMSFGSFPFCLGPWEDACKLSPFWLPKQSTGVLDCAGYRTEERPLAEKLWAVDAYKTRYLEIIQQMLEDGFDKTTMGQRIEELADLIRDDVYADTKGQFSNAQFEASLTSDINGGFLGGRIKGLLSFVEQRADYLEHALDEAEPHDRGHAHAQGAVAGEQLGDPLMLLAAGLGVWGLARRWRVHKRTS